VNDNWELHLRTYSRDGVLKNAWINPLQARYTNSLGGDEPLVFTMTAQTLAEYEPIVDYDIVEVMIRNRFLGVQNAGRFVRDFVGIVRGEPELEATPDGVLLYTWRCPEAAHVLSWRSVSWFAGVANRSEFTNQPAETVVKTLVQYNATADATVANGRLRDGNLGTAMQSPIAIEPSAGRGDDISLTFFGGNLLASLDKACELGRAYYAFDWQGGSLGWAHEYVLSWGRGSDKTSGANAVILSLENRTLLNPRRLSRWAGGTVAVSMGQGEGVDRAFSIVQGAQFSTANDIEVFADARSYSTEAGRIGQGLARLEDVKAELDLQFDVLTTSDVFYSPVAVTGRKTYTAGDIIVVSFGGVQTRRIRSATVEWRDNGTNDPFSVSIVTEAWE
jgi:hypothetical protein